MLHRIFQFHLVWGTNGPSCIDEMQEEQGCCRGRIRKRRSTMKADVGPWKKHGTTGTIHIWSLESRSNYIPIPILSYIHLISIPYLLCTMMREPLQPLPFRYKMHLILLYWLYCSTSDDRIMTQHDTAISGEVWRRQASAMAFSCLARARWIKPARMKEKWSMWNDDKWSSRNKKIKLTQGNQMDVKCMSCVT